MKVYGALEVAQLEWFTAGTLPTASSYPYRAVYTTDKKQVLVSDGTNWLPSALTSYTASTVPSASAHTNEAIFVSDLLQVQVSNGTAWISVGSKSGAKNYFQQSNINPDFETNAISPWTAFTTTLSSGVPTTLTASATQMALSTTATTPLAGTYSGQLVKSAANAMGQGFISGLLTVDREDLGKVMFGSFSYELIANAANFDASGSSTQSLEIWVYNITGAYWIQPSGYRGMNQTSGPGKVTFSFQTDSTAANNTYKIAIITAQTATTGYTINFDDFQLGPQAITTGTAITDWTSFTMSITGSSSNPTKGTTTTDSAKWRRVGDTMEILYNYVQTGAGSAGSGYYIFNLPSSYTIDTAKLLTTNNNAACVGSATVYNGSSTAMGIVSPANNATGLLLFVTNDSLAPATMGSSFFQLSSSTINLGFTARVPIAGWSSNVQVSNDTDTRKVQVSAKRASSSQTIGTSLTKIQWNAVNSDSHGTFDSTTNYRYTVPVSGTYTFSGSLNYAASGALLTTYAELYKNGTAIKTASNSAPSGASYGISFSFQDDAKAGDYYELFASNSTSNSLLSDATILGGSTFDIVRLSGPSIITATEDVNAQYATSAGPTYSTGNTIVWGTKNFDTHNGMNASTGVYTIPISGKYRVSAIIQTTSFTPSAGTSYAIDLCKNGTTKTLRLAIMTANAAVAQAVSITGSILITLVAGDTIQVIATNSSGSITLASDATINFISIERDGN